MKILGSVLTVALGLVSAKPADAWFWSSGKDKKQSKAARQLEKAAKKAVVVQEIAKGGKTLEQQLQELADWKAKLKKDYEAENKELKKEYDAHKEELQNFYETEKAKTQKEYETATAKADDQIKKLNNDLHQEDAKKAEKTKASRVSDLEKEIHDLELKQRNLNATYQRNIRNKKKGSKKYRKLANRYKEDNGSLNTKLAALREELYQLKEDKQVVAEKAPELVIASSSVHSKETTMTPKNSTEKPVGLSFLEKNVQDLESQMEQLKRLHKNKLSIMNVHGSQKDIDRENAKYNKKFKDLLRKISQAKYELSQA